MATELGAGLGAAGAIVGVVAVGTVLLLQVGATGSGGAGVATTAVVIDTPTGELMPASGHPVCDQYRHNAEAYGYCLYTQAGGFPRPDDVDRLCPLAGEWESQCRHAWVAGRMEDDGQYEMEFLLDMCKGNPDCTFELLDFRPAPEIEVQLERCRKWAGQHADDCTGHAMQRWWQAGVDAEEVARVAAMPNPHPRKVGFWLAAAVQCQGVGACDGASAVQAACEGQVEAFTRKPERCPSATKAPLQPGNRPTGAVAGRGPGAGGPGRAGGRQAPGGPPTPGPGPNAANGPGTPGEAPAGVQHGPATPEGNPPDGGGTPTPPPPRGSDHVPGTIPAGLPPRPN